jgi:NAD+ synthase (glutamine-hydrolysing)
MKDGFIKVAAATPEVIPADCQNNAEKIIKLIKEAHSLGVQVIVFPELSITAYTCADLFLHDSLLSSALEALKQILDVSKDVESLIIVGVPLAFDEKLYNCAAVIFKGIILGVVPKKNLANYNEFYESRYFTGGDIHKQIKIFGQEVLLSNRQIFVNDEMPEFKIGVEICEDLWVIDSPSIDYIKAGAFLIANLSASNEVVSKADYRKLLVASQSGRGICGYIYCDSGLGESSTDMVFSGHNIIAENGVILKESKPFSIGLTITEIDLQKLKQERLRTKSITYSQEYIKEIPFSLKKKLTKIIRFISKSPFLPKDSQDNSVVCQHILNIQAHGLATRLKATGIKKVCLGLSGGLDSAWALYVAIRAFEILGYDKKSIYAISMPSIANIPKTKNNAKALALFEGVTFWEIPIVHAIKQHIKDIGLSEDNFGIAYENAQARERTQILMDIANETDALMIGAGDLSELALGFTTYGGDHMSMYAVNVSIPKTLIQYLINYLIQSTKNQAKVKILTNILNTPISPELVPSPKNEIIQKTESIIGPYELHDFFLYYMARYGFGPQKIFRLARRAFKEYSDQEIKKWLTVFLKRFFANQFKRSCLPDGPKVTLISLSPRADWKMSSDTSAKVWQKELEML